MNKVVTINLNGNAYQLEEEGYETLRAYLETAAARLQGNPDRGEILSDIERAIAEKFRALLGSQKTVMETKEVAAVVAEMGPVENEAGEPGEASANPASGTGAAGAKAAPSPGGPARRLYRIREGEMIAGVCNGIAAYMNVDPTFVRLAFVLVAFLWGTGVLVYLVMAIVVPEARSPEEKAAASGPADTAQEFIRRAREGYYEAMKGFPDRQARREWKRRFKREMRASAEQFRRQWQWQWHGFWLDQAPCFSGLGFALPFLSMLIGAATVLWLCSLISLLGTGAIFGVALPPSVPVWLAAILLTVAYGVMVGPLKLARRACYWGMGRPKWSGPFIFLFDGLVGVAVFFALVWLGYHYLPEVRQALHSLPGLAHQAADDVRGWWKQQ